MPEDPEIIDAIKRFVDRPREGLADRIKKFAVKAEEKWGASNISALSPQEKVEWTPLLEFFAPFGYRPLFEQEIVFLMDEGISYEDIMRMPIHLRKRLIDRKIEARTLRGTGEKEEEEISESMLEQIRLAKQSSSREESQTKDT